MHSTCIQTWLPGLAPEVEQPELPGFDPDDIEPSEGDLIDGK